MIVIDASVLVNVVADDGPEGQRVRSQVGEAGELAAPDLVDVETVAVLRRRWLARTLSDHRFASAVADLADLEIDRYPVLPFMRRAYELRANVTAYDAAYVALAETLDCELWTGDRRLANAHGPKCAFRVIT